MHSTLLYSSCTVLQYYISFVACTRTLLMQYHVATVQNWLCEPERVFITHMPETDEIFSFGSGYTLITYYIILCVLETRPHKCVFSEEVTFCDTGLASFNCLSFSACPPPSSERVGLEHLVSCLHWIRRGEENYFKHFSCYAMDRGLRLSMSAVILHST